jgi:hypothetical protein
MHQPFVRRLALSIVCGCFCTVAAATDGPAGKTVSKIHPTKLVEPLAFGEEAVEVTESGTLRRRYRVWGDYSQELAAWKAAADKRTGGVPPKQTFRLGCIFLDDCEVEFPEIAGADGKPLRGVYSTPAEFREKMPRTAQDYSDFTYAFSHGELKCEWLFDTVKGLKWKSPGKVAAFGCQPRAVAEQIEPMLAKYKDAKIDMWVFCAGAPKTLNGKPAEEEIVQGKKKVLAKAQTIGPPPYGISYTQWQLHGGYSIVICAPHLGLVVHEVNHRYLDNLREIEGLQLTQFHGLSALGYEFGDVGFDEADLGTYRAVYLYNIRPAMWRRFSLVGPHGAQPETFSGKMYAWKDVSDDAWFKLPLLGNAELAQLTGLPSLEIKAAKRPERWRHFIVAEADRAKLTSPYTAEPSNVDVQLNNLLAPFTESAAVLKTPTGHWLIVRPEAAEIFDQMLVAKGGKPLEVAGWINEDVCPLVVFKAPSDLAVPKREIEYFR